MLKPNILKVLIVSATEKEVNLLLQKINDLKKTGPGSFSGRFGALELDFLVTGVGLPFTIFNLTRVLLQQKYDLVINTGIAGAFKETCPLGEVTFVLSECFADLGIDNRGDFQTIFDIGLCDKNSPPFSSGRLINKFDTANFECLSALKKVHAVSVNKASGDEDEIVKLWMKFQPDIESMEGAGIFFVCLNLQIPFIELRSISNRIETRDTKKWNIPLSLINLNEKLECFLNELEQKP